jgi:23S rRNA pseudouridine2605 synthase
MTDNSTAAGDRLAKVIARSGMCSRRDAEEWIKQGRVVVNGAVIRTPAFNVTDKDKIKIDGAPLAARSGTRVWLYHKPPGLVVTEKDPEGRATIFEALEEAGLPRVLTVGRLDLNTEGLLLLTNDGGLKRVLELPATGWLRRYRVRAFGSISQAMLDGLKDGIEVEGIKYGPIEATLEREQGSNVWLVVSLREGKNREVKNVLGALGLEVNRLIRVSYGPFQLGDLPPGGVEVVKARVLRDQLGKKLAEEAGVDFESDMPEVTAQKAAADPSLRAAAPGKEPPRQRKRPGAFKFVDDEARPPPEERARPERPGGRYAGQPARAPRPARPEAPPRRVLFDDGRPPAEFRPEAPREKRDRDDDGGKGFGGKPFGDKRRGPREGRPLRAAGDRPARPAGDRPARAPRDASDRPRTARGPDDRPRAPRTGDSPDRKPFVKRDRPDAPRPARPADGDRKPYVKRERSDAPRPARAYDGDRKGPRPARVDGKPFAARPAGAKPYAGKPGGKPYAARPGGAKKPYGERAGSDKPRGPRPEGAAARGPRPDGAKPRGPRPDTGKPRGPRPGGARPSRPAGDRPPRKPRS